MSKRRAFGSEKMHRELENLVPKYNEADVSSIGISPEAATLMLSRGLMLRSLTHQSTPGSNQPVDLVILPNTPAGRFYMQNMAETGISDQERQHRWNTFYLDAFTVVNQQRFQAQYPELHGDF